MSDKKEVDPLEVTKAESIRPGKLIAGAPIGGYSLLEVLGEGGMGVVWSANDPILDRTLAIKVLKRTDAAPALRLRLLREARAMARLKHPNVLTVYEVGTEGERDFIAMELVEGGTLDEWLTRNPTRADVMSTLLAAGRGLAAAHAAGLVHRDFKPHNVLRSKDGRVLVTDFGLARGLGEEVAPAPASPAASSPVALDITVDASSSGSRRNDSVLDSPLTKTGAMIGTPAYMAPEQFAGSQPDPRTDQFAYCVTAWQALTGIRPFHGTTLDELRKAASAGVTNVVVDLAKPLRTVLQRGLDPDPAKRWPDLDSLLEAFERAGKSRTRRWPYVAAIAVIAAIVGAALLARHKDEPAIAACEPGAAVFASAWSDEVRGKLRRSDVAEPVVARVVTAFDDYRRTWLAGYEQACKEPNPRLSRARVECARGLRDDVAATSQLLQAASRETFEAFDPYLMLPSPSLCSGRSPSAPPAIPDDQPRRRRILAVIGKTIALRARPTPELAPAISALEAEARSIAWPPLVAKLLVEAGVESIHRGDIAHGRELVLRALPGATDARDARLVAIARLALLDAAMHELEHPGDFVDTKPDAMHEELARQLVYVRSAVKASGDEAVLRGELALLEAEIEAQLARHRKQASRFNDALSLAAQARRHFEGTGDVQRLARAAALEASIYLTRGDDRALDDALFAARSADEALDRAHLPPSPAIDAVRAGVAFARGDFAEAHKWLDRSVPDRSMPDRSAPAMSSSAPSHTGVVLETDGRPAAGATVVAWTGELHGDPRRLYTDRRQLHGDVVETAADGTFTIHAEQGAAIVAQHGQVRSTPTLVTPASLTLHLAPTVAVAGAVDGQDPFGVDAFARYTIGADAWLVHVPIAKTGAFHLDQLARGAPVFGTIGRLGTGTRRVSSPNAAKLVWPEWRLVDVIVRGDKLDDATVWVFRELTAPRTRADAERLVATSTDVASGAARPIGAEATDAGRGLYAAGDRHAIVATAESGSATACVAIGGAPAAPVACKRIDPEAVVILLEATK